MKKQTALVVFAFLLVLSTIQFSSAYGYSYTYANQVYAVNKPSYYGQYNYRNEMVYNYNRPINLNTWQQQGHPFSYDFPYRGSGPYIMQGKSCNVLYGCNSVADSHMYVDNVIDYTYYTHPELLEPRYMNNHQRYVRGLWPESFPY